MTKRSTRIIGYKEALERLKKGEVIHWLGGANFSAYFTFNETVRIDTLIKLHKDRHITGWGYPNLHGTIKYKGKEGK
jgi:hypothetical protein